MRDPVLFRPVIRALIEVFYQDIPTEGLTGQCVLNDYIQPRRTKSGHNSSKEHLIISNVAKFVCEML